MVLTWEPIISAHTVGVGLAVTDLNTMNTECATDYVSQGDSPWGGVCSSSFPSRSPPVPPTTAWSWIWGRQVQGESSYRGGSPSAQAPSTSLALGLEQTQWRKGCILDCFWTEPRTPAQMAHSFTVITWASLTSALRKACITMNFTLRTAFALSH